LNDENSPLFSPEKGLRQGDLSSPLLFNLVGGVFTRMLIKATRKGHITSSMSSLYSEGVLSLQYADDTLLFLKHDNTSASILKWIILCFEQLSG
jgi:hypothetical protein